MPLPPWSVRSKQKSNNLFSLKRYVIFSLSFLFIWSCHTWNDKDLYIQEVFVNEKNDPYLILKNLGHADITEHDIDLIIQWDSNDRLVFNLDSLDPHFRKKGDSSIISLPFHPGNTVHHITARVDSKNKVIESDEDHNIYSRSIYGPLCTHHTALFQYPANHRAFDARPYLDLISKSPMAHLAQWDNGGRILPLQYWPNAWKDLLLNHIDQIYKGQSVEYPDTLSTGFTHDEAFDIYLSYLAHSLYVEQEHLVPWSINDFDPSALADIWDAHQYFQWDSIHHNFQYNYQNGGAVKLFHPLATFLFGQNVQTNSTLSGASAAITSILNWSRAYLHHTERTGQIYYQSVPLTWYPPKGNVHAVYSCWATGALIMEYARAFNLPVRRSTIDLYNGLHTQLYFPLSSSHLTHADDIYDPLFYPAGHDIPVESVMMNETEYKNFISHRPMCLRDTCHSSGTQHTYDRRKFLLNKALVSKSPFLLNQYDEGNSIFKSYLRGDEFNSFLIPIYDAEEQVDFTSRLLKERVDRALTHDLMTRYQDCKNNMR